MANQSKQEKFLVLRAQGVSYAKIAAELKVSKTTLVAWGHEYQDEIYNLRQIQLESLKQQCALTSSTRLKILGTLLDKLLKEIEQRDFSDLATDKLVASAAKIADIVKSEVTLDLREPDDFLKLHRTFSA